MEMSFFSLAHHLPCTPPVINKDVISTTKPEKSNPKPGEFKIIFVSLDYFMVRKNVWGEHCSSFQKLSHSLCIEK